MYKQHSISPIAAHSADRVSILLILLSVVAAALALWVQTGGPAFRLDDAYIVLNNAEALVSGDASFPEVSPLHGSTSIIHTLAVFLLGQNLMPETALYVLSWTAILTFACGAFVFARNLGLSAAFGLSLALLAATSGDLLYVNLNGLETGWMMAALMWALVMTARDPLGRGLAVLAAFLPFIRPELVIFSAFLGCRAALVAFRGGQWRRFARSTGLFVVVVGALLFLQWTFSGSLFPGTGGAKKYFFQLEPFSVLFSAKLGIMHLTNFVISGGGPIMLAFFFVRGPIAQMALVATGALTIALILLYPSILGQNWYRYLYYFFPIAIGLVALWCAGAQSIDRFIASMLIVASLTFNVSHLVPSFQEKIDVIVGKRDTLSGAAAWMNRHLDPEETVLLHDIGYLSWATDQRMFDLVGLRSPEAVEFNRTLRFGNGKLGQAEALEAMLTLSGACTYVVSGGWNIDQRMTRPLIDRGWQLTPHPAGHPPGHEAYLLSAPSGKLCAPSGPTE